MSYAVVCFTNDNKLCVVESVELMVSALGPSIDPYHVQFYGAYFFHYISAYARVKWGQDIYDTEVLYRSGNANHCYVIQNALFINYTL